MMWKGCKFKSLIENLLNLLVTVKPKKSRFKEIIFYFGLQLRAVHWNVYKHAQCGPDNEVY